MRTLVPLLLCIAIGGCGSQEPPASPPSDTGIELFVNPRKSLYVEPGMPLAELLERYTQRMGWSLLVPEAAREKLAAAHCEFTQRIEVPFGSVHGFVEALVRANGLYLRFEHRSQPIVLQVLDPDDKQQGDVPANRMLVPLAEVPRWGAHPAHMITAQAQLPAGDTKELVSSLRAIFGENARGVVQQTGDTNTILFTGTGTEVARLVRVLEEAAHTAPVGLPSTPVVLTSWIELLHAPAKGLHVEDPSAKGMPIEKLLDAYLELMGWQLVADSDVLSEARNLRLDARLPLDVPPENVHAYVEGVLRANGFILEFAHPATPVLLRVTIAEGRGERLRANAMDVDCDELPRWAGHTDFLLRTKFNLPGVDVRALSNSLRQLFNDTQRQQILPIGADGLLVTGYASEVAHISELLRALVDEAAGKRAAPPPSVPTASAADLFVVPLKALHLERPERGELKLSELVEQYAQLMGWRTLMGLDTRNQLVTLKCGLALPMDVPPERVHSFVESVLQVNDFVLGFAHASEPVLLYIASTNVAGRGNPRSTALLVPPAELSRWAAHPAFLVSTCLDLPGIDVRTLSNSLRQMFSDQATQQIVPMGNSDSLLVTGFGSDVAAIAKLFRGLSDAAAGVHERLPAVVAGPPILELLAPPRQRLHLEESPQARLTLSELVDAYAQGMGWRVLVGADTRNQLRTLQCGIALPVDVAAENVHSFVEGILRANNFVLGFAHAQEPILLAVESIYPGGGGNARREALNVPAADLPRWAAHPDFLITTWIDLPGIDVRTLSNSLRQMFSDQQTQQVISVGNSDGLIVTGFGSDVAAIASSLRTLVDAARGVHAALPPPLQLDSGIGLFVTPSKPLHLEQPKKGELRIGDVLESYAQSMGWRIVASVDDWDELRRQPCKLELPMDVVAPEVQAFVEGVARANNVVLSFASTRTPVLLRVAIATGPGKGNPRREAICVRPEELPRWADHPAFLVTTMVDLPGLDVRVLSNELRKRFSDQRTQQIIPMGNADGLIVTGFANDVAMLVASLSEDSRKAMADRPPAAPVAPAAERARLFPQPAADLALEVSGSGVPTALALLEAFGKWTQRPLEISEDARNALSHPASIPPTLRAELVYPCVGVQLDLAGCTLLPMPASAPVKWVIDVQGKLRERPPEDWPRIALADLSSWGAYSATPFRAELRLPVGTDPERVKRVLDLLKPSGSRSFFDFDRTADRTVQLWGTPRQIQTAAGMIRQACEPLPAGGR